VRDDGFIVVEPTLRDVILQILAAGRSWDELARAFVVKEKTAVVRPRRGTVDSVIGFRVVADSIGYEVALHLMR